MNSYRSPGLENTGGFTYDPKLLSPLPKEIALTFGNDEKLINIYKQNVGFGDAN